MDRGEITQEQVDELRDIAVHDKDIDRTTLEKVFKNAMPNIDRLAAQMHADRWDIEVMQRYFRKYHNEVIAQGIGVYKTAPESFKDLCRVHIATIIAKPDKQFFMVEYKSHKGMQRRAVFNEFLPEADIGDKVRIHYAYAVEFA
ncbi:hypothetical protein H6503_06820 [Candidatus Woesearchaeota archaeon]|nr:hypothetical protein [Candidatus Woesearchaeota archaeon]